MLTPNDEIVKNADAKALKLAREDDDRHRLHAEAATSEKSASPYFKRWSRDFITPVITSASKRKQVLKQFVWPPVTVELVDEITDMASAVHHAEDRFIKVDLSDASLESDWNAYAERMGIQAFITRNCHSALFSRPNSLVVVDLPTAQVTAFPEPYVYLLTLDRVRAAKPLTGPSDSGLFEFVWFDTDQSGVTALFDTVEISLHKADQNGVWQEIPGSRVAHNQPYCPVFKMWDDVEDSNPMSSNTMIRPLLGLCDRILFWDMGAESNDLAAAFMMFWHWEESKKQPAAAPPVLAQGLPTAPVRPTGKLDDGTPYAPVRPTCQETDNPNTEYGPGSKLKVPAPQRKEDPDLRPPAGWIGAPVDNLKYVAEKVVSLRQRVRQTATGYDGGASGQPMNERQILQILERSRIIYNYLAEHYEVLTKRILETIARYRYGAYFNGVTASLGRRFSLLTGEQLMELYKAAKDAGLGWWILEELTLQQQEYFARTDASRKLRYKVMRDLNPYPEISPKELRGYGIDLSDPFGYTVAVSLLGFIYRFERENELAIEEFCNAPDYDNRISQILKSFKRYGDEREPIANETDPNADPKTNKPGGGKSNPKNGNRPKPAARKSGAGND